MDIRDETGRVLVLPDAHPATKAVEEHLRRVDAMIRRAKKEGIPVIHPRLDERLRRKVEAFCQRQSDPNGGT